MQYEGTVLFVSHDRYFINKTATRVLDLYEEQVDQYIGNYDYYLEKKDVQRAARKKECPSADSATTLRAEKETDGKQDWKQKKMQQAMQRKLENELHKTEERITQLETQIKELEAEMAKPEVAVISAKVMELHTLAAQKEEELEALYVKWEELTEAGV